MNRSKGKRKRFEYKYEESISPIDISSLNDLGKQGWNMISHKQETVSAVYVDGEIEYLSRPQIMNHYIFKREL